MELHLVVTNREKLLPNQAPSHLYREPGGSLGRSQINDWVICDQQRFVSSKHAKISFNNGHFVLTDTSTNGITLNSQALGKGNSRPLANGDRLAIGELEISVEVKTDSKNNDITIGPAISTNNDIFSDLDIFGTESRSEKPAGGFDDLIQPIEHNSTTNSDQTLDPLALLGERPDESQRFETIETGVDFGISPNSDFPELDTPANQPFTLAEPFDSNGRDNGFIPDDWDFLTGDIQTTAPSEQKPAPVSAENADDDLDAFLFGPAQNDVATQPRVEAPPAPVTQTQQTSAQPSASGLREILRASGLDPQEFENKLSSELIGKMLLSCVGGLVTTLMARSQVKSGFRMAVTTIAPVENNPLKFSINGEEALRNLLSARQGYLSPVDAINEGFTDLQTHQLALMAALQQTLNAMVERLNPALIIRECERNKSGSLKIGSRKAQYWDAYEAYYNKLKNDVTEDFQNALGDVFAEAYEAQINNIKSK